MTASDQALTVIQVIIGAAPLLLLLILALIVSLMHRASRR